MKRGERIPLHNHADRNSGGLVAASTVVQSAGGVVEGGGGGGTTTITGATFTDLGWFNVEDYGAVHDGTTDDTAAIQSAIDACMTAGGGTVYFPQGTYQLDGALQDTGTYNAQLEIPYTATQKLIRFLGGGMFLGGSFLRSSWAGTITGNPAVISAGTHDSLTINQAYVVFEDIAIQVPVNPKLSGVDMTSGATCRWRRFSIAPSGTVSSLPTNANAVGLDLPYGLNDQNSGGEDVYINGFYTGIRPGEQMVAEAIYTSFCTRSVEMRGHQGSPEYTCHSVSIQRLNVWFCQRGIVFTGDLRWIDVELMDVEHNDPSFTVVYDIDDASNYGRGFIRWHTTDYTTGTAIDDLLINGGTGLSLHGMHARRWSLNNVVDIPTGTNPSTNPTNGRRLYTDSSTGHLSARTSAGSVIDYETGGGTPAVSVTDETSWGITPAVGTDTEYARQDHTHGTPAEPTAGGPGHSHVVDEQFSGNGSTTVFPLANSAVPDSVMAWVAGVRTPVTLGGALDDEITFGSAPASGTLNISVDYAAATS